MESKLILGNILGWLFGSLFLAIGLVNTFWGNDPFFGIFILLGAFVYFPPSNELFRQVTRFSIPVILKVLLGLFFLWAALGVGELSDKVHMMMVDFSA